MLAHHGMYSLTAAEWSPPSFSTKFPTKSRCNDLTAAIGKPVALSITGLIEPTRDPQALLQQLQVFLSLHEKGTKTGQVRVHQLSVEEAKAPLP